MAYRACDLNLISLSEFLRLWIEQVYGVAAFWAVHSGIIQPPLEIVAAEVAPPGLVNPRFIADLSR
jgi:hypothetical protein